MAVAVWREVCSRCGRTWELAERRWRCACGGLLDMVGPVVDPLPGPPPGPGSGTGVAGSARGTGSAGPTGLGLEGPYLERYRAALPPGGSSVTLGAPVTPAVEVWPGVWVKADYEQPTGSFKDRGAAVMVGVAASIGVTDVLVDSSGNAGRAVAAYAGRAGLHCTVYLPEGTDPAKVSGIAGYGAEVVEVQGGRGAAAAAAAEAASVPGAPFYASHVYQPTFHHGVKTLAFELFEQIPGVEAGTVVVPAGNGTLVLGLWLGFGDLVAAGRAGRRPAIVAVQADRCAPLAGGQVEGAARSSGPGAVSGPAATPATAAAGIAIPDPPRAAQIRGAALASGGAVMVVSEEEISAARSDLTTRGYSVEPTGAVAWAAVRSARPGERSRGPVVAVLTGR